QKESSRIINFKKFLKRIVTNLSSSSNSSSQSIIGNPNRKSSVRQRKPLSRLPFPNMMGPKCLRLVEVVNSVDASRRRKKSDREEGSKMESHR
ncbi:hypothetical protein A2U01_0056650, partial [Trifolium medium]|nr:hypothetical protein [Trifolium medium]